MNGGLCVILLLAAQAETPPEVPLAAAAARVRAEVEAARDSLSSERETIARERAALRERMLRAEEALARQAKDLARLSAERVALEKRLHTAQAEAREARADLAALDATVRENRKEAEAPFMRTGPVGNAFAALDAALEAGEDAGASAAAQQALLEVYLRLYARAAGMARTAGAAILPDGSEEAGQFLVCGAFGGVFQGEGGTRGVLALSPGAERFHVAGGRLPRRHAAALREAFEEGGTGDTVVLPLDLSGGYALARLASSRSWREFLAAGGVLMIPLGVIAAAAFVMILERVIYLSRVDARIDALLAQIMPLVVRGELDSALRRVELVKGPVGRVLAAGITVAGQTGQVVDDALQNAMLIEMPRLERFTGVLRVFAHVAPLLGLLGTVSGIIATFGVISVYGGGDARLLSGGISEALITTQVGLAVAVPIIIAHAWLVRRVKTMVGHMERAAITLGGAVRTEGGGDAA